MEKQQAELIARDCYLAYIEFYEGGEYLDLPDYPLETLLAANKIANAESKDCLTEQQLVGYFAYGGIKDCKPILGVRGEYRKN